MKKIAIIGAGLVGQELAELLMDFFDYTPSEIKIFARSERTIDIGGIEFHVRVATPESFDGIDIAFFAGTEGEKGASQTLGWEAVRRGCIVIDNGDDFRMDDRVPLVIPEINPEHLERSKGFIANPNCSTIIALMALAPLHKAAGLKRVVASTYQAVSGAGSGAMEELESQTRELLDGGDPPLAPNFLPYQIGFNVVPHVGSFKPGFSETTEEIKMRQELHKILGDDSIGVSCTCVRVPVFDGHSISLNVEFKNPISPEEARNILEESPGVRFLDGDLYPTPINVVGMVDVFVGRIRKDETVQHGLSLWCCGDNIWKGAALNAIQIAELIS